MSAPQAIAPSERISAAIRKTTAAGSTALVPYITAGYPHKDGFIATLKAIAREADVVDSRTNSGGVAKHPLRGPS